MVAIGENEIRGSMHSGWNQSSRMFLRGYTTHINRLPTLRSSISITKVAIVLLTASFSFIFHPSKIYFDGDSIDAYFKSFPLSFMRIVDTNRSDRFDHADTTTDRYEITIRYYTSFIISLLFYFSFFSSLFPFLLLSLFSLFPFFSNPLPISRRDTRTGDLYGKGRWRQLDPRQIRSFLLRLYERVTQSPPPFPMMLLAVKTNFARRCEL